MAPETLSEMATRHGEKLTPRHDGGGGGRAADGTCIRGRGERGNALPKKD